MGNDAVTELLNDAYLVLLYAVRAGRLRDDALPKAIKEVEASLATGELASLVRLSEAMNGAVTAIAPITLVDLRAGRSPFDSDPRGSSSRLQYWLCALTVLLAALIAFYSFAVQRKEGALREYQDIRAANIPEKVNALYRLSQQEDVRTKKEPRYEQYQRSLNEIQNLDARDQTAIQLLAKQSVATGWPFQGEMSAALHSLASWLQGLAGRAGAQQELAQNPSPYADLCEPPPPSVPTSALTDKTGSLAWRQVVSRESADQSCFKQIMGIRHGMSVEETSLYYAANIRDNVVLLSVWILPFLSGLLGATVFLLRDSLSPMTASFGLARVFVRLALGGVAGIIIGWFWVPSGTLGIDFSKGSPVPMALSFLTGFSIDILFSALDRLRTTLSAVQESGKTAPK